MDERKERKLLFYTLILALSIMCGVFFSNIQYISILIGVGIVLYFSDYSALTLFLILPFAPIFKFSPSSSSMFTYLEILYVVVVFLRNRYINKNFFIVFFLFTFYTMLGGAGDFQNTIKMIIIPAIVYFGLNSDIDFKKITLYLSIGIIVSSIYALIFSNNPILSQYIKYSRAYDVSVELYRFSGLSSDPNYYSANILISIAGLAVLFIQKQISLTQLLMIGCPLILFGVMTVSKSFILVLVLVYLISVYVLLRKKSYGKGLLLIALGIIVVMLIISGKITLFNNILERFSDDVTAADLTTGRTLFWKSYLDFFDNNFLNLIFGVGAAAPMLNGFAAHNTYLEFIYYFGIIGTLLLIGCCLLSFQKNEYKLNVFTCIPLITFAATCMALSALKWFDFPFSVLFCLSAAKVSKYLQPTTSVSTNCL